MNPTTFARAVGGIAFFHNGQRVAFVPAEKAHLLDLIARASLIALTRDDRGLTVAKGAVVGLASLPALIFEAASALRHE